MAALKIATVCMLILFVGSDLARLAICLASSSPDDEEAAAGALLRELLEREREQHGGVGEFCPPACQICLINCGIACVLNPNPATCYANCIVTNGCFNKTLPVA